MLERVSQLELTELNRALMARWLSRAPERAAGFALEFYAGAYPDADMPAIVELLHVMNDAPREGLELEDERLTAEDVRGWQHWRAERGVTTADLKRIEATALLGQTPPNYVDAASAYMDGLKTTGEAASAQETVCLAAK